MLGVFFILRQSSGLIDNDDGFFLVFFQPLQCSFDVFFVFERTDSDFVPSRLSR